MAMARSRTRPGVETTDYPGVTRSTASAWVAWLLFAAIMLILLGAFQATIGFVALFNDGFFLAHRQGQLVAIDYSTWGWVHIALAAVALVAGLGLLVGALWARIAAVILCLVNMIVAFAFVSVYPAWGVLLIVFSAITAYAILVHGGEVAEAYAD
jgi:hypothetical protein